MLIELATAVGVVPSFSSRAFVPAFALAALAAMAPETAAGFDQVLASGALDGTTPWFEHQGILIVLGLLALIEIGGTKQADIRAIVSEFEPYIKPIVAAIALLGYLGALDAGVIAIEIEQAGFFDWVGATFVGGSVFVVSQTRTNVLRALFEADEDDDSGLQGLLSWVEDLWSALGIVLVVILPILMLLLAAVGIGGLWLFRKHLESRETKRQVPCTSCNTPMYAAAFRCPACNIEASETRALSWLGVASKQPAGPDHDVRLRQFRRCVSCATRLPDRSLDQTCPACRTPAFGSEADIAHFDAEIRKRLPKTLLIVGGLSFIPVIGLLPALIYGRLEIVAPYRRYIPRVQSLFMKIALRLLMLLAIAVQFIPGLNALLFVGSTFASHWAFRAAFLRKASRLQPSVPNV